MNIVIAAGGTGGHIIPALRTAEELRARGHLVRFVGSFRMGTEMVEKHGFDCVNLEACGLVSYRLADILRFVSGVSKGMKASFKILKSLNPDRIAGFGGYPAFPVVLSGALQGIPVLIHEQNVVPGKANKVMAILARRIAISFPQTKNFGFGTENKKVLTGCPANVPAILPDREKALTDWGFAPERKTVLIFGGSQGSRKINDAASKALILMKDKISLQAIHITGRTMQEEIRNAYEKNHIPAIVMPFCDEMDKAYACADIVVARSGALTVTELGLLGKRAVLIPYPFAGGHQKANALVIEEAGLARIIDEKALSGEVLAELISAVINENSGSRNNREKFFLPYAAKRLADEIETI
jgi:UDP-N-acetylglucosamine--N-acetylmuramyl-(pentapeptide) pyrophosphoryl-undecaprenol N-acetylglucosamine transferase